MPNLTVAEAREICLETVFSADLDALIDAVRRECAVGETNLRDDVAWLVDQMVQRTDLDGTPHIPPHDCEFTTDPEKGACAFHERFTNILESLGYFGVET